VRGGGSESTEKAEQALVAPEPSGDLLGADDFRVRVVARAKDADEEVHLMPLVVGSTRCGFRLG
jgi:hypothetical protein